jgi:hypothetical protein
MAAGNLAAQLSECHRCRAHRHELPEGVLSHFIVNRRVSIRVGSENTRKDARMKRPTKLF